MTGYLKVTLEKTKRQLLDEMRQDCKDNLFIFAQVVCGFDKFVERLHKPMCDFLQYNEALRKMVLVPRDHYKSSVVQAFILWKLVNNPEERILIAGDTASTAENKLIKIRQFIEGSSMLRLLFPEIVPRDYSKVKWSDQAITIVRKGAHAEPSLTAAGVSGARAGAHYTIIICDDIFTKEAKDQPATRNKIIDWFDGTEAMLEEPYSNPIILVGTPWTHDDVYEHARKAWGSNKTLESGNDLYAEFFKHFFSGEEGDPIFPELYDGVANALDFAYRMSTTNPYLWSANFLLKPQLPDAEFTDDDLQYYSRSPDGQYILYRSDDRDREPNVVPLNTLKIFLTCDPAFKKDPSASKAAINVSAVGSDGNIFILESVGVRGGTNVLIDKICELCMFYGGTLSRIGVELVGQQQSFIDYLNTEMRRRGIYKRVDPLTPGSTKSKEARIRSILQPYFSQKRIWVRPNMVGLIDEFRKFPLSRVRDELDAMAYAADHYWKKAGAGLQTSYEDYLKKFNEDRQGVSELTGY